MGRGKLVFLRRREVELRTGLSRSTIYKKMAAGTFPRPEAQVGTRGVRWIESDITKWMQSCLRAQRVKANQEKQRPKSKPKPKQRPKSKPKPKQRPKSKPKPKQRPKSKPKPKQRPKPKSKPK